MPEQLSPITIENAEIIFRNFAGKEGRFNGPGERSFAVILTPEVATAMAKDGWNVKALTAREEDDSDTPYISVKVSFEHRPPRVVLITSTARTQLSASNVDVLDYADIRMVDLILRPYYWEVGGKSGWKAYLQSMFVTIEEDELERKYAINDVPPSS